MERIYQISGISRQAHHKSVKLWHRREALHESVLAEVRQARLSHPRMGARPLYHMLDIQDIGINAFERLLSDNDLGIKRKHNRLKTTDGHLCRSHPANLVNGLVLDAINQLWVSDITYFMQGKEVFYIFLLMDVYSRRVLGADIFADMKAEHALSVLRAAFKMRGMSDFEGRLIHHSDRGSQYLANAYRTCLREHGIQLSAAENSLQNGYAERLNGIIKNDYLQSFETTDLRELRKHLRRIVNLYNCERPHSALDYLTPVAFENSGFSVPIKLYDFNTGQIADEFFSGISLKNEVPKMEKQAPLQAPATFISEGQGYSLIGCSSAELLSASPCLRKDSNSTFHNHQKVMNI